jgi:hypothetical protein
MSHELIEKQLLEVARQLYDQGPGFAQESVVLQEARERLRPATLDDEQKILTCWHNLFQKGSLSWGYNLDNPTSPWYHLPNGSTIQG